MRFLLLADIHGNMPALQAVDEYFRDTRFDAIINCGDSVVYAPFANEVLTWLQARNARSILGNTDKKVIKLLKGKSLVKPGSPEKRVMFHHTAEQLTPANREYLRSLPKSAELPLGIRLVSPRRPDQTLAVFHGSPARHHEFLFSTTPGDRFLELAILFPYRIVVTGHSHTPYHITTGTTDFINPGSVGRMFDGNPAASCAVLEYCDNSLTVRHYRLAYKVALVIDALNHQQLPDIYQEMYLLGRKLN